MAETEAIKEEIIHAAIDAAKAIVGAMKELSEEGRRSAIGT